jgi:hypothetical protein
MKFILLVLLIMNCTNVSAHWKVDFSSGEELNYWYRVNDSVMGGLSQSNLRVVDNVAYFEGELSLQNNGGFASVRRVGPVTLNSGKKPITIEINGVSELTKGLMVWLMSQHFLAVATDGKPLSLMKRISSHNFVGALLIMPRPCHFLTSDK